MAPSTVVKDLAITGYLDEISVRPGGRLALKSSATGEGEVAAELVAIGSADANPDGPGVAIVPVEGGDLGTFPARRQEIALGSYGVVPTGDVLQGATVAISFNMQPWLLRDTPSALIAVGGGFTIAATRSEVRCDAGGTEPSGCALPFEMKRRVWYRVTLTLGTSVGRAMLSVVPLGRGEAATAETAWTAPPPPVDAPLCIAAAERDGRMRDHFNGRIEDVRVRRLTSLEDAHGSCLAFWDFSRGIETQAIVDAGPQALNGRFVNFPMRAVRGSRWDGTEHRWIHKPDHYAAVHFHEDDIGNAGWGTDLEVPIPDGCPSGIYGVRLSHAGTSDVIPFYVLPPRGKRTADVVFLASTFTYQAYANHARGNLDAAMRERIEAWGTPEGPDSHPQYGFSTYNFHPDGSGTAYSSRLRPVLTMRPGFLTFAGEGYVSGLRHFPADSHLTEFFRRKGIAFDVVTDEDLHREGADLIAGYPAVVTSSHPEYHTRQTLDALKAYTETGGHLAYLGGNGFYWRIATSPLAPGILEVRRAEGGIRAWATEAGENYHALDGEYGGLWRRNGRPPQELVGVGFSSQGLFEGSYYRRTEASYHPAVAWVFDGVDEEKIGDYGFSGGGAAGFELDRADHELGTPDNAVILARSEAHSDSFVVVPEELLSHLRTVTGEPPRDLVRAEMVLMPTPGGGQVFSTGSITFCGSLPWNDFDNGVARILQNVLARFTAGA
ncbi:N,N-dimethylformamidase beta subunit family domain-containing protein [Acuticoccus sediminis]|nr:N,N-dimethylformamidase beta subunit family domain-containing protein [Acuticoccus sediminis]